MFKYKRLLSLVKEACPTNNSGKLGGSLLPSPLHFRNSCVFHIVKNEPMHPPHTLPQKGKVSCDDTSFS